jgi:hypothetical protein
MQDQYPIVIPLSKWKLFGLLFLGLGFVAIGLWLIFAMGNWPIGLISVLFFGTASVFSGIQLFSTQPGLTITMQGLIIHAPMSSEKMIYWTDIEEIWMTAVSSQQFISLGLKNPQAFIEKEANPLRRSLMKMNLRWYGTPFHISTSNLKIDFHQLYPLIVDTWEAYKDEQQLFVPAPLQDFKNRT